MSFLSYTHKKKNSNTDTLIEKDHLGDWSPEKALDSEDHFRIGCKNVNTVLLRTPITQMIFFN